MGRTGKSDGRIKRWLTASANQKEGRFIQVGDTLVHNKRFISLTVGARYFYLLAAMEAAGERNFQFPASRMEALGIPVRTGRRHLQELEAAGFIEIIRSGKNTRTENDYQFCFRWLEPP